MPRKLLLLLPFLLFANSPSVAQEALGLRISALTSAERDAMVQLATQSDGLQVAFACVPAGVIVFSNPSGSATRESLRAQAMAVMHPAIDPGRIEPGDLSLQAAEAACENARGQ